MTEFLTLVLMAMFVFFGAGATWLVWQLAADTNRANKFNQKKNLFQWKFSKLLLSYKIYILKKDIKEKNVPLEELDEIEQEAIYGTVIPRKHVLEEVEEEVRGEVEQAEKEVKQASNRPVKKVSGNEAR